MSTSFQGGGRGTDRANRNKSIRGDRLRSRPIDSAIAPETAGRGLRCGNDQGGWQGIRRQPGSTCLRRPEPGFQWVADNQGSGLRRPPSPVEPAVAPDVDRSASAAATSRRSLRWPASPLPCTFRAVRSIRHTDRHRASARPARASPAAYPASQRSVRRNDSRIECRERCRPRRGPFPVRWPMIMLWALPRSGSKLPRPT